ncbi:SDR family oxidoreductase [Rhodococcoides navarretei]|uniref:SDR family oxidoreductase n=1 Tax=Rhodococcus navarretei TaxID=3128981 RepID=A0ABU9D3P8_9NOCA
MSVTFFITGGTGFLGRRVIQEILDRDSSATIHVLVRTGSLHRVPSHHRVLPVIGDLTEPGLGIDDGMLPDRLDHVVHLGAIYDLTAGDDQAATNVQGTREVALLALRTGAVMHHVSSIAVAGDFQGRFTEHDFDLGQGFPTAYHRTKFEAEKLVRSIDGLDWKVYRPAAVIGDSRTGEMDKIDGPYYLFGALKMLAALPAGLPVAVPAIGATNLVPVDVVTRALVHLMLTDTGTERVFHLVNPTPQPVREVYQALAAAAGAPHPVASLPGSLGRIALRKPRQRQLRLLRAAALRRLEIPSVVLEHFAIPTEFSSAITSLALRDSGVEYPPLADYATGLWTYWYNHLDPTRARRQSARGPLAGRHIVITGASSGIGRATAIRVADMGALVILLARNEEQLMATVNEIRSNGGCAFGYVCDVTDSNAADTTITRILAEHDHVDMLINNAGRSIRRSLTRSMDRFHDFERTMAVNYFGAVRMTMGLLPQMRARRFGHVVNISSAAVQNHVPRFAAYVASKSALDGFSEVAAAELLHDGITFTTIHLPLVDTPMISPSDGYHAGPITSPETAAAMVVRALVKRPRRIDVPLGTIGEWGHTFTPRLKLRISSVMHQAMGDSPAARGAVPATAKIEQIEISSMPGRRDRYAPKPIRRLAALVPGTQW